VPVSFSTDEINKMKLFVAALRNFGFAAAIVAEAAQDEIPVAEETRKVIAGLIALFNDEDDQRSMAEAGPALSWLTERFGLESPTPSQQQEEDEIGFKENDHVLSTLLPSTKLIERCLEAFVERLKADQTRG
jgi:hypothetical protein